jgi:AraC-like DNA-binding protein
VERPNESLSYWRHHDLGDATLVRARYGPFVWEKHVHDEQVVVVSECGVGEVETRRGRQTGGAGTIWVFMPGEYHCGQVQDGWQYRGLYLDDAAIESISRHFGVKGGRLLLRPGLHDDPDIARVLLRAHASIKDDAASQQTAWNEALSRLFERYGDPRIHFESGDMTAAACTLARSYICEHFRDDISIDDLAQLVSLSRYHFIRAFRTAFGMPPHAYINQMRLQHARKLLIEGRSVSDAAAESGFYDQSRLSRLFKRVYGVTPARYAHLTTF